MNSGKKPNQIICLTKHIESNTKQTFIYGKSIFSDCLRGSTSVPQKFHS